MPGLYSFIFLFVHPLTLHLYGWAEWSDFVSLAKQIYLLLVYICRNRFLSRPVLKMSLNFPPYGRQRVSYSNYKKTDSDSSMHAIPFESHLSMFNQYQNNWALMFLFNALGCIVLTFLFLFRKTASRKI